MTTMELNETLSAPRSRLAAAIARALAAWRQRRRFRRQVIELSQLDARLLRDMGIEPADVADALRGRKSSILLNPTRRTDHQ